MLRDGHGPVWLNEEDPEDLDSSRTAVGSPLLKAPFGGTSWDLMAGLRSASAAADPHGLHQHIPNTPVRHGGPQLGAVPGMWGLVLSGPQKGAQLLALHSVPRL